MMPSKKIALFLLAAVTAPASAQSWDPYAQPYASQSNWLQAAVATLNRHLPTDSGFFVLGPTDLSADLPDTLRLVETTLRILAPDPTSSRRIVSRLRLATGGVAMEELQPADTLLPEFPPGYPGRLLKGTLVGQQVYLQVMTVQEHRWVQWADRAQLLQITDRVAGPLASYSQAVTAYLAAVDSGKPSPQPPQAIRYGLDPSFDLYAQPPEPVIRGREGYLRLLNENRDFSLEGMVNGVAGFVPGSPLAQQLKADAEPILFRNKDGEVALQHRYRDFALTGGHWSGNPVLSSATLSRLSPGRYAYSVDRYGFIRVGRGGNGARQPWQPTPALLAHGDPVRVAGELELAADSEGALEVRRLSINSEEYFFSNRSLTLYPDVEQRSDRYMRAVGHALKALDDAHIPREHLLITKL